MANDYLQLLLDANNINTDASGKKYKLLDAVACVKQNCNVTFENFKSFNKNKASIDDFIEKIIYVKYIKTLGKDVIRDTILTLEHYQLHNVKTIIIDLVKSNDKFYVQPKCMSDLSKYLTPDDIVKKFSDETKKYIDEQNVLSQYMEEAKNDVKQEHILLEATKPLVDFYNNNFVKGDGDRLPDEFTINTVGNLKMLLGYRSITKKEREERLETFEDIQKYMMKTNMLGTCRNPMMVLVAKQFECIPEECNPQVRYCYDIMQTTNAMMPSPTKVFMPLILSSSMNLKKNWALKTLSVKLFNFISHNDPLTDTPIINQ